MNIAPRRPRLSPHGWALALAGWALALAAAAPALGQAPPNAPPVALAVTDWETMLRVLSQRVTLTVVDEPLDKVAEMLSRQTGCRILLNETALDDLGIGSDEPVTASLRGVTLFAFVQEALGQLELTWLYRNEGLVLTTEEEAETQLVTRVYPVRDFLALKRPPRVYYHSSATDELIDLIVSTVASETWAENGGGEAEIRVAFASLVVSQTQQVHLQIDALLNDLRRVGRAQGLALGAPGEEQELAPRSAARRYLRPASAALPRVYDD